MPYLSPFSHRYGSEEMRRIWSEAAKRRLWRQVWFAVAEAQTKAGLVTASQLEDIQKNIENIDLARSEEIEEEIGHDLMAELRVFSEQCQKGGSILHWGLTSADVQDNAEVLRQRLSLNLLRKGLRDLLLQFADFIEAHSQLTIMGYTHLQPAEPTTLGYRMSLYASDFLDRYDGLARLHQNLRGKGIRGPVGTSAPFIEMLEGTKFTANELEEKVMASLGLTPFPVTAQIYPRIQDFSLVAELAALAGTFHKFGMDLRVMQSPGLGDLSEPFSTTQVGSSAMPFKRNPVKAEKLCSLARLVASGLPVAWDNAANNLLERTLDDSANRRRLLPESFLACEEMLSTTIVIIQGLVVDEHAIQEQLERYGSFASIERVLTALVKAGADRQEMHEHLRQQSMRAWDAVRDGKDNPLTETLASDTVLLKHLQPAVIRTLLDTTTYTGLAAQKSMETAGRIKARFANQQTEDLNS